MAAQEGNLVQGEASESDEEYEINQSYFMKNTMVVNEETTPQRRGIVVEGEASESDEEEGSEDVVPNIMETRTESPQQQDIGKTTTEEQTKRKVKFHYDSYFHRKLRVSNLELRSDAVENTVSMYHDANKKLKSAVFHLNRSQASIQEIFSNVALISGDLQSLTEVLDKTSAYDFVPNLQINIKDTTTS